MGRRSINTTKSGKYMNPTDQARKEARKKELKKNKRQRQMVRAAVLKMKDPMQILEELEKIDEMEYNVHQPSPLNEKVLKEKRKKLKETLDRVLKMYDKDEPEKWTELKRQEGEYERRRAALAAYHESVRHAQAVQIDEIPLPTLQVPDNVIYGNVPSQIPLPMEMTPSVVPMPPPKPTGILKKDPIIYKDTLSTMDPPGVPPGPPPNLADYMDDDPFAKRFGQKVLRFSDQIEETKLAPKMDVDVDTDERTVHRTGPPPTYPQAAAKPTSLQQRMLALSGQNIDDFMKEMEEVHKKTSDSYSKPSDRRRMDDSNSDDDDDIADRLGNQVMCPPGTGALDAMPMRPPPLMNDVLRPPPPRPPGLPPGMVRPPGRIQMRGAPPGPPPGPPPRPVRMPPGPPPGPPPRAIVVPPLPPVLTAAPRLVGRKDGVPASATIMAKPQIRNLSADVTRFVPSALRIKRDDGKSRPKAPVVEPKKPPEQRPTKDDAYMQFMREMQGLL